MATEPNTIISIIGNMGNPVITRLGRSQIWYRKWYTDLSYGNILKINHTFENILDFYFKYGFFFNKNLFMHDYWYRNTFFKKNFYNQDVKHLNLYFRRYYYAHKTLTIEHTYLLRLKTPEYFPLRLYILKYLNWLLVSIQWFKPSKLSKSTKITKINTTKLLYKKSNHKFSNSRSKLLITYLRYTFNKLTYKF